ncbi:hypothetical protein PC9H_010546 [Pleurotus ostreatus]|uniref:Uncharacterized protein n=2 Tax=Pleurotus TaxID=5320 RepID=A0A8H6ZK21_PLEOS|nr:uncharacterized protein PC9H_010546 [Pleurotus ostreatus]KAF7422390.1 hypothetical protein PC9H_010546 [Pleurotus ostreatus]KAG9227723.1 hypothetical protein CCMSSC00406_0000631 [Pleurotus cornucopiae]KAJ8691776.1 hypothetical protein PTI98_011312 [Pleurotus ostreatus]
MVLHHISLPPLSEVRQRLRRSIVPPKLPTHQHILLVLFAICLILFARALGGYGQVKGHALIHCPLLSDGHKYLPIALMHEGKIAELNIKLKEEEMMARMAIKNDRERRAEAVDGELQEETVVNKGEPPADEVLVEEQMPVNDLEQPPTSDAAPIPPALTEGTETFADDGPDEAIYEPDLKGSTHDDDEGESVGDVGDAGPFHGEDGGEVMAEEQILD